MKMKVLLVLAVIMLAVCGYVIGEALVSAINEKKKTPSPDELPPIVIEVDEIESGKNLGGPASFNAMRERLEIPHMDPFQGDADDAILSLSAVSSRPGMSVDERRLHEFYSEDDVVELAMVIHGEAKGCNDTQKAAAAWCVLNRADAWGQSIHDVISEPDAFYLGQATNEEKILARDVLNRWSSEKRGFEESGRVLPKQYLFFSGNGEENRFRKEFDSRAHYNWSLGSPYL